MLRADLVIRPSWVAIPTLGKSDRRGVDTDLLATWRLITRENPSHQLSGEDRYESTLGRCGSRAQVTLRSHCPC